MRRIKPMAQAMGDLHEIGLPHLRRQHPQRRSLNPNFHRRIANVLSVRINRFRMLSLNPYPPGLEVFDLTDIQMTSRVDAREHAAQPERSHPTDDADVE